MALFAREFECPSCGGTIKSENPASRSISCGYCGQTSHINADSVEAAGNQHLLIDYGSIFEIGKTGTITGSTFKVLGKLRIKYEDGFWDEWFVYFTEIGKNGWIQEDDGAFVLFSEAQQNAIFYAYDDITVGGSYALSETYENVFITSKGKAEIEGGEGELPFPIIPGEPADFIEGIQGGQVVSVEILPDEYNLFVGRPIEIDDINIF